MQICGGQRTSGAVSCAIYLYPQKDPNIYILTCDFCNRRVLMALRTKCIINQVIWYTILEAKKPI